MRPAILLGVRGFVGGALVGLCGCFNGDSAFGLPCTNDVQCGTALRCEQGVCGGAPSTSGPSGSGTSSESAADSSTVTMTTGISETDGPAPLCSPVRAPDPGVCTARRSVPRALAAAPYPLPEQSNPTAVTVGDYVGDGALDLAVGLHTTQTINILRNTGSGEFVDTMQSGMFANRVVDLVATDLECDGEHEFFVVGYGAEVEWVRLSGENFSSQAPIAVPEGGYSLAVGDLIPDEDNLPEIVVAVGHLTEDVIGSVQVIGRVNGELASGAGAMGYAGRSPWESSDWRKWRASSRSG